MGHSNLASVTQINWCDVTLSLVEIAYPQARVQAVQGVWGNNEKRESVCAAQGTRGVAVQVKVTKITGFMSIGLGPLKVPCMPDFNSDKI